LAASGCAECRSSLGEIRLSLYWKHAKSPFIPHSWWYLSLRLFRKSLKFADVTALCLLAFLLVGDSGFAFRCRVNQHQMNKLARYAWQRRQACMELGLRWEADDQERQYRPGTSAGTNATVGPISGFVMDVTENEFGHAEGRCHAANASYRELVAEY
jgi:hypothetical protein